MTLKAFGPAALLFYVLLSPVFLLHGQTEDANRPSLVIQNGHSSKVNRLVYSTDGRFFASGSQGGAIKIWDARTNRLLRTIESSAGAVTGLAFSRDNQFLAATIEDDVLTLWDLTTGEPERKFPQASAKANSLSLSPDGKFIATAHDDETVRVWQIEDGSLAQTLTDHASNVTSVAYSSDGKLLASGSGDRTIKLWAADTGELLDTLEGHAASIDALAFSPDSQTLFSESDGVIKKWQVSNGRQLGSWETEGEPVSSLVMTVDGRFLLTGNRAGAVKVRQTATGVTQRIMQGPEESEVSALALSSNGRTLLSGDENGVLRLWEFSSGRQLTALKSHSRYAVASLAFSPDGTLLAAGCGDGLVRLWSLADGQLARVLKGHENWVASLAFSPDGRFLASGSDDESIKIWEVSSGRQLRDISAKEGSPENTYGHSVLSLAFSPDGRWLAAGHDGGRVKLWTANTWRLQRTFETEQYRLRSLAFSADGQSLAVGAESGGLTVWTSNGQLKQNIATEFGATSVAFSTDGRRINAVNWNGELVAWLSASGQQVSTLNKKTEAEADSESVFEYVRSAAQSSNGLFYATGGEGGTVRLLNARQEQLYCALDGHNGEIWAVAFSPDGRFLASGGLDHTVKLWAVANGQAVLTMLGLGASDGIAYTKEGYYTATPGIAPYLGWTVGDTSYEAAQFRPTFNKPAIVAARLRGTSSASSALQPRDSRPPEIRIITPAVRGAGVGVGAGRVTVEVEAKDSSGISEVRIAGRKARAKGKDQFVADVPLLPGDNSITVEVSDNSCNSATQTFQIRRTEVVAEGLPEFRYYALVIGNDNYARLPSLLTAGRDAIEVAKVLREKYGFQTQVLRNATRAQILDALEGYRRTLSETDCLLIYYAGHGYYNKEEGGRAYWQPVDAEARSRSNWVSADDITNGIKLIPARHILIVSDSCYSGVLTREANETTTSPAERSRFLAKVAQLKSRVLIASGGNEPVSDEGPSGHSVFAAAFLNGLRTMERDVFTAEELFRNYVREKVGGSSSQLPEYKFIQNSGHDGGDFIFKRKYR